MAATYEQKKEWKQQAMKRIAEKKKEQAQKAKNDEIRNHLRMEERATAQKAALRKVAHREFIKNGGSDATFESNWERLHEEIVFAKTVQAIANPKNDRRKVTM